MIEGVGEVEVIAENGVSVEDAERKINEVIQLLGVEVVSHGEGKMHCYLLKYHRELYDELVAANVL